MMTNPKISRRTALQWSAAAAAGAMAATRTARAVDYTEAVPEAAGLTAYQKDDQVLFRHNNMPLTSYRAGAGQKYPYFYPVIGLASGMSLTAESGLPYPHHRGLWFSCDPLNGGNYWADNGLESGQVKSTELSVGETSGKSATLHNQCQWVRSGAPSPCRDERTFTVSLLREDVWVIDADITWIAEETIEIERAKHSLFAIRAASDISCTYGGTLENSEGGQGADGTYGKEARWCGYYGKRRGRGDLVEGISVMTHPENPWKPIWFTREYGHLSPSPFNFLEEPWRLEAGKSVRLRYRIALHSGTPKDADLESVYGAWLDT